MFGFMKKNKELETLLVRIHHNEENNYKDAAQEYLKKYEERLCELEEGHVLNEKQKEYYERLLAEMKERLDKFTHKDQTPYWT